MTKLIHEEISYETIGALFDVHNELGPGHKEQYYQKALLKALRNRGLHVKEQVRKELKYIGDQIGIYVADFIINEKLILEIKKKPRFSRHDYKQAQAYLQVFDLQLAILAAFGHTEVLYQRVLNPNNLTK
ncbi:GxxExxY protein [Patescibacteria group bacterium]|nr:GxxExxY protein [Patescibacteria group bacterium]MBU1907178.1 GxxExxY protein [Patescibacteria group bacterium]